MKFSGTPAQLFKAIEDGGESFQCIGQMGSCKLAGSSAGVAALVTMGAGVVITSKLARKKQDRRIEQLVGREVKKAIKARQPKGLSFDLFG